MPPHSRSPSTSGSSAGPESREPPDRPEVLPFLPFIHVAWCDGVLTPEELEAVAVRIREVEWIGREERESLLSWLDPSDPPTPTAMESLRDRIRREDPTDPDDPPSSLTDLGIGLARKRGGEDGPWASDSARKVLEKVEAELGVVGPEAVRELLDTRAPRIETPLSPTFDVGKLHRFLDQDHFGLRLEILSVLGRDELRFSVELDRATYRDRVREALAVLAQEGYGRLHLPESFGGEGSATASLAAFRTLAYGDLSVLVKFGVQFGLFGGSVLQLGTEKHHRRYLEEIGSLELPGCFAMTETGHGSNVRELETTATYHPEHREFVIRTPSPSAEKDWIGGAAEDARMATVFAQLRVRNEEHGVHAFLVPLRDEEGALLPGIEIRDCGPKMGLHGVDNGRIAFREVRIPRENLLDRFADVTPEGEYRSPIPGAGRRFFTTLRTLVAGRISIAAASVSVSRTALTVAVRYSHRRRQFGPAGAGEVPVLDYLLQQRLLLPRLAATYGIGFAVDDLIRRHDSADEEAERRKVEVLAAGLKAYASDHAVETLRACREACGARGYHAENRLGALIADAEVFTTFEGANPVLLQLVAKGLLSEFREEMGDLDMWDIVKYIARRAGARVSERNPVITRRTDEEHLRDPEFHRSAFQFREERLLASAARRLKARIDEGTDSFDAVNACQDHLATLARAHVERVIVEAFQDGVKRAPDPGLSEVLTELATLFALSRIEAHRGWFLESGYMEGGKTRAVRELVNRICGEVRKQAPFLVDAFGIPDEVLQAPDGLSGEVLQASSDGRFDEIL